jgi:hypothetical protein
MYATGVGLMMKGLKSLDQNEADNKEIDALEEEKTGTKKVGFIQKLIEKSNKYFFESNENLNEY